MDISIPCSMFDASSHRSPVWEQRTVRTKYSIQYSIQYQYYTGRIGPNLEFLESRALRPRHAAIAPLLSRPSIPVLSVLVYTRDSSTLSGRNLTFSSPRKLHVNLSCASGTEWILVWLYLLFYFILFSYFIIFEKSWFARHPSPIHVPSFHSLHVLSLVNLREVSRNIWTTVGMKILNHIEGA